MRNLSISNWLRATKTIRKALYSPMAWSQAEAGDQMRHSGSFPRCHALFVTLNVAQSTHNSDSEGVLIYAHEIH